MGDGIYFTASDIPRSSYCGECGQIGCHCDGYDDSDDE